MLANNLISPSNDIFSNKLFSYLLPTEFKNNSKNNLNNNLNNNYNNSNQANYPNGLVNNSNYCFINSILQSLASLDSFRELLIKILTNNDNNSKSNCSIVSLLNAIIIYLNISNNSYNKSLNKDFATRLLSLLSDKENSSHIISSSSEQQDAEEFLQIISSQLETEIKNYNNSINHSLGLQSICNSEITTINNLNTQVDILQNLKNPFEGTCVTRIGCLSCKEIDNLRTFTFTTIHMTLSTDDDDDVNSNTSLQYCLGDYTNADIISDVHCNRCTLLNAKDHLNRLLSKNDCPVNLKSALQNRYDKIVSVLKNSPIDDSLLATVNPPTIIDSNKSKQIMFLKLPQLLAFHFSRSDFNFSYGTVTKNNIPLQYPIILDMSPYVISPNEFSQDISIPLSRTNSDLNNEDHNNNNNKLNKNDNLYTLKAVLVHYGAHNYGHYITYRLFKNEWYRTSDSNVTLVSEIEVLEASNVYMLFYEKLPLDSFQNTTKKQFSTSNNLSDTPILLETTNLLSTSTSIDKSSLSNTANPSDTSLHNLHSTAIKGNLHDHLEYPEHKDYTISLMNSTTVN